VAAYIKRLRPEIKVIGVETFDADAMKQSLAKGHRVRLKQVGLFADGTAVKFVGEETFRLCKEYLDDVILVDTDAICAAIKDVFEDTRSILEPAGALAVAGAKEYARQHKLKDKNLIAITSGANMNFDRLRFVAERAEVRRAARSRLRRHAAREARRLQEIPLADRQAQRHRIQLPLPHCQRGPRLCRRSGADRKESLKLVDSLQKHGYPTLDLTDDEMAKNHIRHMVGGHAPAVCEKGLKRTALPLRIPRAAGRPDEFPDPDERRLEHQPLPLPQPRRRLRPRAGRHAGAAGRNGRVQGLPEEPRLRHWDESENPAYKLFLG
jgi:threonine dehydratase